jgi:hypothetical protein
VVFDRLRAEEQCGGDVAVGVSASDQERHPGFLRGQGVPGGGTASGSGAGRGQCSEPGRTTGQARAELSAFTRCSSSGRPRSGGPSTSPSFFRLASRLRLGLRARGGRSPPRSMPQPIQSTRGDRWIHLDDNRWAGDADRAVQKCTVTSERCRRCRAGVNSARWLLCRR